MTRFILASILAAFLAPSLTTSAQAQSVAFDNTWKTQRFSLFSSNKYGFGGRSMSIASDGSVSLAYARVTEASWGAKAAKWSWGVTQSVPATDLAKKGGDDRNASLYFVFLPEAEARALGANADVRKLLTKDSARVLTYVWGDNRARGTQLASPYLGSRGKTILLRAAGTGQHSESVNLVADYKRAFGGTPGALVGLAVSADSDDTKTAIRASISGLSLN
ncbi:Protein of unknown function [Pseudorhodobacter antarcticus]|jgi:hypothetical protein|uniref:DUF3047 domain-containing protein n=1 Tax=Pseudorhodobacter antarcticus TaxID=1077947 RepID=A0A1H8I5K5_9RHOB|nr:DUF3047 domain-containing protein [Pseudorhodobacter antarcticus]SEN63118.1 Protein of unknown function [Pseudorhodobacter antarcticus]